MTMQELLVKVYVEENEIDVIIFDDDLTPSQIKNIEKCFEGEYKILDRSTLILDILKAVIPILVVKIYFTEFIFISSLSVFLGHVFPIWLKFNGGKGVATYVGILFCINYILGLCFIISWAVVFLISKYSSLSSLLASLLIPVYHYFFIDSVNYYFFIIMFILIFYTHKENIKRLKNNTESKTKIY